MIPVRQDLAKACSVKYIFWKFFEYQEIPPMLKMWSSRQIFYLLETRISSINWFQQAAHHLRPWPSSDFVFVTHWHSYFIWKKHRNRPKQCEQSLLFVLSYNCKIRLSCMRGRHQATCTSFDWQCNCKNSKDACPSSYLIYDMICMLLKSRCCMHL